MLLVMLPIAAFVALKLAPGDPLLASVNPDVLAKLKQK